MVLVIVSASIFWIWTGFLALASANRVLESDIDLPLEGKLVAYILLVIAWPADVIYNVFIGTIRFQEFPQELTYSDRIQRLVRNINGPRYRKAYKWALVLNAIWPGHIDLTGSPE